MSQAALAALRDANSLAQTLTFEQLEAYHVPFDELTGTQSVERELSYWSERGGRAALIGASGAGKSSVMAGVLGAFSERVPEWLVPVRVPVELAGPEAIRTTAGFGRHVVRHVLKRAAPEVLSVDEQESIGNDTADLEHRIGRRRRAGFSLGLGRLLPVDASLSGDLTGAATDLDRQVGSGDVVAALIRLVELFRARQLEPFFVFDDTDHWLRLPGQEQDAQALATDFFANNVQMLTREVDCGFVLAVHSSYIEQVPAFARIAESLEPIELPVFDDAPAAIERIVQRRMAVDSLEIAAADVFDPDSLAALGDVYVDAPDLRLVMSVAALAVRKSYDAAEVGCVSRAAVLAAWAERDTARGRR